MPGDLLSKYGTGDATLTTTNLQSLASSASWVIGWCSDQIDNTTVLAHDYLVGGEFQVNTGVAPTTGTVILVLAFAAYRTNAGAPIWPTTRILGATSGGAAYAGSEGLYTLVDVEQRDSPVFKRLAAIVVDANLSRGYEWSASLRDAFGSLPPYTAIYVAQATGQALNSANTVMYTQPKYGSYT